jgi:hypothetical protein
MELDISSITGIITAVGVVVGVIYYILEIRHQTRIRETDLAIRMNPSFNLTAIEAQQAMAKVIALEYKDYDDFAKKYGSMLSDTPTTMAVVTVCNYFEAIGYLRKRRLLGIDYTWDMAGEITIGMWEKIGPVVEGLRKQLNMPRQWEPFEYLYDEMKKREQQLASKTA